MKGESILVDASAVLAVILEEPEKAAILEVTAGCEAKAPGCLRWEIGNAFSAMVKRGRLTDHESLAALRIFETIPVQEVYVNLGDALALAMRQHIYAYDAYYLMAAKNHRVALLTLDSGMSDVARAEGINLKEIP
jgi:predicted nucleic acid-binding protein